MRTAPKVSIKPGEAHSGRLSHPTIHTRRENGYFHNAPIELGG